MPVIYLFPSNPTVSLVNCFRVITPRCNLSPFRCVDGARMQTVQNRRICPVAQIAAWQFVCSLNDNNLWWAGRKLGVEPNHFSNLRSDHHRAHLPEKRDKNIFFSSKPLFTLVAKVGPLRFVRMTDDWWVWLIVSFADGVFGLIEIWRQNGRSTAELIGRGVPRAIIPSRDMSEISNASLSDWESKSGCWFNFESEINSRMKQNHSSDFTKVST